MEKPTIKKLSKMAFTKLVPDREEHISQASDAIPPAPGTYKPNQLASALHPAVQHAVIVKMIDRGPKFRSFILAPDPDAGTQDLAYFQAGQYVSVEIEHPNGKIVRPFSLCSSPNDALAGFYQLTLERVEGGYASDFIWNNWREGTRISLSAPLGEFVYEPLRDASRVVALVGGSAITPVYSMAKAVAEGSEDFDLTILYATNTYEDAVLQEELQQLVSNCERLNMVNILCDEDREGCERGFITLDIVRTYAPAGEVSYFICGPLAMRRAIEEWLPDLGVRRKFIQHELFGEYRNPEADEEYPSEIAAAQPAGGTDYKLTVRMAGEEHTVRCNTHDTLLNSMEHAGIHAPAHCRSGVCGWCHSRLVSGDVHVPSCTDGRRAADKKFGYVHPCATFPLSDIVLEVPPFAY